MSMTPPDPAAPLPKIRGTQIGLKKPWLVDQMKADMLQGRYGYEELRGRIGGILDRRGRYHITEGRHRMAAALEIYHETGDGGPIRELIRCGRWDLRERGPSFSRPLPSRGWWRPYGTGWDCEGQGGVMADVRISCAGVREGPLRLPPFDLRVGEAICLHLPAATSNAAEQDLIRTLTGRLAHPGCRLLGKVYAAAPAQDDRIGLLRLLRPLRATAWLRRRGGLSRKDAKAIVGAILDRDWPLMYLAGNPRTLLGLEAAWGRGASPCFLDDRVRPWRRPGGVRRRRRQARGLPCHSPFAPPHPGRPDDTEPLPRRRLHGRGGYFPSGACAESA